MVQDAGAHGSVRLIRPGKPEARGQLSTDHEVPPPPALDGWAFALLPLALRTGGRYRVEGPVTRNALRNLTEIAEAWSSWDRRQFPPLHVEAARVVDGPPPAPATSALVAWSGSLRSTHVLLRQLAGGATFASPVRGVVRVWGGHAGERNLDPVAALQPARQALAEWGCPLHVVRVSFSDPSAVERDLGLLPWAVAALHRFSAQTSLGWCARSSSWTAHTLFPRPGPLLPDLWSGDHMMVRYDGGTVPPARMVKDLSVHPSLLALVSNCTRRPRHAQPCGRCAGCRSLHLARSAAGQASPPGRLALFTWPMQKPADADDVYTAAHEWPHPGSPSHRALLARLAWDQRLRRWGSTARWIGSVLGWSASWPR